MAWEPPKPSPGSGGSAPAVPTFKSTKSTSLDGSKISKRLRNAVASGDIKSVDHLAVALGLSDRDRKAILWVASQQAPHGFLDRLTSDVSNTFTGLPSGIAKLGTGVTKELVAVPRLGVRAIQGKPISTDEAITAIPGIGQAYAAGKGFITHKPLPDAPFSSSVGTSFANTAGRTVDPNKAVRDYSAHPFSTFVEDAGNVAIVAGGASKVAGALGAETAAGRLAALEAGGLKVANLPFLPVSVTAKGANYAIARLLETSPFKSELATTLHISPEARALKPVLAEGHDLKTAAAHDLVQAGMAQTKLLPTIPEQEAMALIGQHEIQSVARARDVLPAAEYDALVERTFGRNYTREAVDKAVDVVTGKNPDLAGRIDRALKIGEPFRQSREAGYLSRDPGVRRVEQTESGRPLTAEVERQLAKPLKKFEAARQYAEQARLKADAERGKTARIQTEAEHIGVPAVQQIGDTGRPDHFIANDMKLAKALGSQETRQRLLDNQAARAERRASLLQGKVESTRANAAASIEAAPARLRPALAANREVAKTLTAHENTLRAAGLHEAAAQVSQIADEIPTTLAALDAAGINPDHFINPQEPVKGTAGSTGTPALPRTRRLRESRQRTLKGVHDMTVRGQTRAAIQEAGKVIDAQTVGKVAELPFVQRGESLAKADGSFPTRAELHESGLEAFNPSSIFQTAEKVGPDTLVMPRPLFDAFKEYYTPKTWEKLFEVTLDPATRVFKTAVLPLSVSWNVGNAITNTLMATLAGGVDPITLAREMANTIATYRRTGDYGVPQRLLQSGSTFEVRDFLNGQNVGKTRGAIGKAYDKTLGKVVNTGYKVNEVVDNIARSAVYNAKLKKGYSPEAALKIGLTAMGDFTKMSPFERRVVRRVVPFYAWLRHMSQLAVRLPIEHPLRTAWILSMSNTMNDQEAWADLLPSYMQGFVPVGGDSVLGVNNFVPFSNPFAISQLGQNLNPLIKLGLTNLPGSPARGINALTGRPYSRRPGTGRQDEFGRDLPTAPSILNQLGNIPPQVRAAQALLGRNDVARYESGQTVLKRGADGKLHTIKTPKTDWSIISKLLGVPVKSKTELQAIVDSIIKQRVKNRQAANPVRNTSSTGEAWTPPKPGG